MSLRFLCQTTTMVSSSNVCFQYLNCCGSEVLARSAGMATGLFSSGIRRCSNRNVPAIFGLLDELHRCG